jgi:hypothetical protein
MSSLNYPRPKFLFAPESSPKATLHRSLRLATAIISLVAASTGCGIFDTTITLSPQEFKQVRTPFPHSATISRLSIAG